MTIQQVILAVPGLNAITAQKVPVDLAFKIHLLVDSLSTYVKNYKIQQGEILRKYGTERSEQKGTFDFATTQAADSYNAELRSILVLEIQEPIKVDLPLNLDISLSASDIAVLLPFINFIDTTFNKEKE